MGNPQRFRSFVHEFTRLVREEGSSEGVIFSEGRQLLEALIARGDWLPEVFARKHPRHYQQYLLYCDPMERFCVVSFVWGPGQSTPVHDHCTWGMIGLLRGRETCEEFTFDPGIPRLRLGGSHDLCPGQVDRVSPNFGDIHRVSNGLQDGVSVSIHVYGVNIGRQQRHIYPAPAGTPGNLCFRVYQRYAVEYPGMKKRESGGCRTRVFRKFGSLAASGLPYLQGVHVLGLRTFLTLGYVHGHLLAFVKGSAATAVDGTEVNEDVLAAFLLDEAEAFLIVEPFNSAFYLI